MNQKGGIVIAGVIAFLLLSATYMVGARVISSTTPAEVTDPVDQPWEDINNEQTVQGEPVPLPVNPNQLAPPEQPVKTTASQKGQVVEVSSDLRSIYTGTCYYRYQNGNTVIEKKNTIANLTECYMTIPVEELLVTGEWTVTVSFISRLDSTKFSQEPVKFNAFF